jgi:hypothetical protein
MGMLLSGLLLFSVNRKTALQYYSVKLISPNETRGDAWLRDTPDSADIE